MKFPEGVKLSWIKDLIQADLIGNEQALAYGINEIHKVEDGDLVFVDHPKYYQKCLESKASHIIINTSDISDTAGKNLLVVKEPFEAYLTIVNHFRPMHVSENAIDKGVIMGENTIVMPNVYIGKEVKIGANCVIYPGVCLMDYTEIGDNVIIQSGSVIGSDAFYYNTKKERDHWYKKMNSCGNVIISDFVEIGAGCTIDRGVTASTIIGAGTKLDNMVHIGHDTIVGKNCLFAAQVGIAGACHIEDGVTLWGQVGVSKTLTIGANAQVMAQSGVPSSLAGDKTYFGYPAEDALGKKRELVWIKRIPQIWKKVFEENR